ncbi:cytochrome c-type biogenesis protein CcmE [Lewinella marina]|uniref:Cytochrome C biogenesis protein n=1 Tax=Neolewinella marina TaxID=438751 RepID=A0A2G0CHU4_9BACT|nr:cytochrome c maturation protein CcmE [Neolewinella marina]NJB85332.1 cytochrome c-type biogenesis protein CcmE [Neolewinella marina]PHK99552.1 cytochrome C biogenesis protein [Neolewinella marina]
MKKSYLLAVLLVVIAVVLLLQTGNATSEYANFTKAAESGDKVQLVGTYVKDKPTIYDPLTDPNYFSFFLEDLTGTEREVILLKGKPQDFEMSESIVLTGRMQDDRFIASDIQMKCPSKYKDEEEMIKNLTES